MLHIPALRFGKPYESLDSTTLLHHRTRQPVATVSQINTGAIGRDIRHISRARDALRSVPIDTLLDICAEAGDLFLNATLPIGRETQSPEQYVQQLSATTGMPRVLCRRNMDKIVSVLQNMRAILGGLTRGLDLTALDAGMLEDPSSGSLIAYRCETGCLGAVMPSNSPGVHGLWPPAIALKVPLVLKPGREEPWTPYRIMQAFIAAGCPIEAFGFYPTDHAGAGLILQKCGRSMLFGDTSTTQPYEHDPRVELHGAGLSKVLIGDDVADQWETFVPLIASSIAENGGRSCLNASGVWTPRHGRAIADAVAAELAKIEALPAEDENARLAAFAHRKVAEYFDSAITAGLRTPGAEDMTVAHRATPRLVTIDGCAYVLPTLVYCDSPDHPLANRELLLPYAAVVECPADQMLDRIGPTLVATAITEDPVWIEQLSGHRHIDRLNIGPIPTWKIRWDQPHEGNLFEHLYRRRAFQRAEAAVS
jgi:acyl-CoA reductase-like NAD-dependent aldehyde dehydrogenase